MPDVKFVNKIMCKDEKTMRDLKHWREPTEEEIQRISTQYNNQYKKDKHSALLWIILSAIFIGFYSYIYITDRNLIKPRYVFFVVCVFITIIIVATYKTFFKQKNILDKINSNNYRVQIMKVHHSMPKVMTSGATIVKLEDSDGVVFNREFVFNKELKKIYKKNPNLEILLIELNKKNSDYGISYLNNDIQDVKSNYKKEQKKKESLLKEKKEKEFKKFEQETNKNTDDLLKKLDDYEKHLKK